MMIIDFILEHVTFLKQMQSFGAKYNLKQCRDFEKFHRFETMILFTHLQNLVTKHVFSIK